MDDEKDDITFQEPFAWVPDGEYKAKCTRHTDPIPYKGTRKVFLFFELLNDPYTGTEIFMALNVGYDSICRGSRYFKYWSHANGNRPPSRNAKGSPRMFVNKYYKIFTRTVKPKRGPEEMGFDFWYSIVDHIELLNLPDTQEDGEAYQ